MEQAFELKALEEKLKAKGLPVLEDTVEAVALAVFEWTEESLAIHENALVKAIGIPAVGILKPLALAQVDKIDGKVG